MPLPKLDVPTYELELPSTGKKIKYRPFLVKEHKVLLTMAEADNQEVTRIITELVDTCTWGKLKIKQLPHFDIEYIFMMLRAKSIGEQVDVVVNCECGNKIDASFNIENITIEKQPGHSSKIMINHQYGVEMNYPKFTDVVDVYSTNDNGKVIDMIVNNVKGVYDQENYWDAKEQSKQDIEDFLYSLTKEQFEKIENFFVTAPKVVQIIESDCNQCGKHNVSRLEGLANFFV